MNNLEETLKSYKEIATAKADEAIETVDGKANTNADNFTQSGKGESIGWGLPDYSAGINIDSGYIALYPCFIFSAGGYSSYSDANLKVNNVTVDASKCDQADGSAFYLNGNADIGDVITGAGTITIYPFKGVI